LAIDVRDVITPFKFGDDRLGLSGLGLAEGQILPFLNSRRLMVVSVGENV